MLAAQNDLNKVQDDFSKLKQRYNNNETTLTTLIDRQ